MLALFRGKRNADLKAFCSGTVPSAPQVRPVTHTTVTVTVVHLVTHAHALAHPMCTHTVVTRWGKLIRWRGVRGRARGYVVHVHRHPTGAQPQRAQGTALPLAFACCDACSLLLVSCLWRVAHVAVRPSAALARSARAASPGCTAARSHERVSSAPVHSPPSPSSRRGVA